MNRDGNKSKLKSLGSVFPFLDSLLSPANANPEFSPRSPFNPTSHNQPFPPLDAVYL
jgi:hypothetical protein